METSFANYKKVSKMVGYIEDLIACCEDKSDMPFLLKDLKYWQNELLRQIEAL